MTLLADFDFQNGVYTLNGVSKTLAEVLVENTDWGSYTASDVVAGEGLSNTAAAFTSAVDAVVRGGGVTFLIVMDSRTPTSAQGAQFVSTWDLPGYNDGAELRITSATAVTWWDGNAANYASSGTAPGDNVEVRTAYRFTATTAGVSSNGAAVGSTAHTLAVTPTHVLLSAPSAAYIRRVRFYDPAAYSDSDLATLSSPVITTNGTASGSFAFTGTSAGAVKVQGTAAGAFALTGTATGLVNPARLTGGGQFAITGSATGVVVTVNFKGGRTSGPQGFARVGGGSLNRSGTGRR